MGSAGNLCRGHRRGLRPRPRGPRLQDPGLRRLRRRQQPDPAPATAHGTACAGVAGAQGQQRQGRRRCRSGVQGPRRPHREGHRRRLLGHDVAKVADGIRKAVDRGADVLSNSLRVGPSSVVTNAFTYAQTNGRGGRGCPIAAATGNGDALGVIYPARLSPTIRGFLAVGASNEWDQRKSKTSLDGENWWGSNYGPEVDVVAPGVHIYTTDITGAAGYGGGQLHPRLQRHVLGDAARRRRHGADPVGRPGAPRRGRSRTSSSSPPTTSRPAGTRPARPASGASTPAGRSRRRRGSGTRSRSGWSSSAPARSASCASTCACSIPASTPCAWTR